MRLRYTELNSARQCVRRSDPFLRAARDLFSDSRELWHPNANHMPGLPCLSTRRIIGWMSPQTEE